MMRGLVEGGKTLIFITHKLEEVMEVSDMVTVLRDGRVVATVPVAGTTAAELAGMMVGRDLEAVPGRESFATGDAAAPGKVLLDVKGLCLEARSGAKPLENVSFEVRAGEILGVCGVAGNGQLELFETLVGLKKPSAGSISLLGREITGLSTSARRAAGLASIPPDRSTMGIIGEFTVRENLLLGRQDDARFSGGGFLRAGAIEADSRRLIREFGIRPPEPGLRGFALSGGNQQKAIVARELARDPEVLIACQPARGLDIGATRLIHRWILKQAGKGRAVLLISADLSEILTLSDRIGVMFRGSIVGALARNEATEENLGLMMAGVGS